MNQSLFVKSGAYFSPDRLYRYNLWRERQEGRGTVNFIMLNPSTADETQNDPTVERCQRRAWSWGYKRLVVTNIFAYRATNPAELRHAVNPVGPDNDDWLLRSASLANLVVCAWGNHGTFLDRGFRVRQLLYRWVPLNVLKLSKTGVPCHPLYLPYRLQPVAWVTEAPKQNS